jgi:hypothetical protein
MEDLWLLTKLKNPKEEIVKIDNIMMKIIDQSINYINLLISIYILEDIFYIIIFIRNSR